MRWILVSLASMIVGLGWAQSLCAAADLVPIPEVQGADRRSPLTGEAAVVRGVVTAAYLGTDTLGGVFVQDPQGDGDPATSDAIFVRVHPRSEFADVPLAPGDDVAVRGTVLERNEMTQLDRLDAIEHCGYGGLLDPMTVGLPVDEPTAWEAWEGMLVAFAEPPTVAEVYNVGRYGELLLAPQRLFIPTNFQRDAPVDAPLDRIVLDDASTVENPWPVPYLGPDLTVRVGDTVHGLTAVVVNQGLHSYRLQPTTQPIIARTNPRPIEPPDVGGDLRVAAFNVLNYFTSLNERGADDEAELERQTHKLVSALTAIDADIVGLIEIENNGSVAVQALVDAVNAALGREAYAAMPDPASGTGSDQIKQAIIYRPDAVELVGSASDTADIHDRPPVAGTFRDVRDGSVLTVVVVHYKSKGGCPPAGDIDEGFGCWNLRRSAQADATLEFAERIGTATGDRDVLVVGDLNSYRVEPPVQLFERAGFVNLDEMLPERERYTYVYFGESGTLDYALASPTLREQVAGMANWHINADEPPVTSYDLTYNPAQIYRPYPFRSSDHDPVIVGLDLE